MSARRKLAAGIAAAAAALVPAAVFGETQAIVGATIETLGPAGTIARGTILVRDGKIAAVGANVAIPADAARIDAAGRIVTPGLFDPKSRFGIEEVSGVKETRDDAVKATDIGPAIDVAPAVNPRSMLIPVNRVAGVTTAMVAPTVEDGGTIFAGRGAVITLGSTEGFVLKDPAAMFAVLGEEGADLAGGSRAAAILRLREALDDARDYRENRAAFDSARRRRYALGRLDLEALQPVLRREIPLVVSVQRASDIRALLDLGRETGVSLVVYGGAEAWMEARELAAARVPVILDPLEDLPASFERLGATLENAARLARAGVVIAFETGDSHNARNLTQLAGNAVAYGLPHEDALRAITVNPAKIYGMAGRKGTIEPGKDADLVIWDGDPLEVTSAAERVFIGGTSVPMVNRQTLLRDRYLRLLRGDSARPPAYPAPPGRP